MSFKGKRNAMLYKWLDPAREAAINEEIALGARYEIDGPLRRVPPYYYTYLTFCKQRWIDRSLREIFSSEFRDRPESYYHRAVRRNLVLINDKPATLDQKMRNGDLLIHRTHKHEQPVSSTPVKIVFEDDSLVVVDKPGGMPAHPTGRFKYNSVVGVLEHEHGIKCHPCNRLDRLTSGLMFLAKTAKGADEIGQQIRDRSVTKQYLALVAGEFPQTPEMLTVDLPMQTVDPKVSLNMIDANGKPSLTHFQRVSFDPTSNRTLVLCMPKTGRTHQIRVHLQHLGFPIANDPIYSNDRVWGSTLGSGATAQNTDVSKIGEALDRIGKFEPARSLAFPDSAGEMLSGEVCADCETPLYTEPGPNDLALWLHALRYYSNDGSWSYETEMPSWAVGEHRNFMDLSLQEARKAPDLDGAFAVGAVLVHNGNVLSTGYTRELPGNTHAEQNALAKLDSLPTGTELYTSMEPCTERLSGNMPCCDRVLSHPEIRTVFVGVMEPATFIANNSSRKKLEDAGLVYLQIPGVADEALRIAEKGHHRADASCT